MRKLLTCTMTALLAMAVVAPVAQAAPPTRESKLKGGKGDGNIRVSDADSRGATDLGIAEIEGRIYKPSVFYVLARGDIAYQGLEFRQSFLDRIVKGALKRPF